ncbi:hypothetical protein E8E11_008168 [Didymella keratinophila]|nr:hypothetical protein E8E11_008168 [Didymella keratinophila]
MSKAQATKPRSLLPTAEHVNSTGSNDTSTSATDTTNADGFYTELIACNGSFDIPLSSARMARRSSSMEVLVGSDTEDMHEALQK